MSKYFEIAPGSNVKLKEYLGGLYEHIPEGSRVLDVGCSTGYFGKMLVEDKHCNVDGVELDQNDLRKATRVLQKTFSFDLDYDWPAELLKERYDVIFYGDVIEHLKFPEHALIESKKLLNKRGIILISTPNIAHISIRLELMAGEFNYESTGILDNTHLRFFTLRTLQKLAADVDCAIAAIDYSLVDFTRSATKLWLKKIGLVPNGKFWKLVNTPEARAYQYKLVLEPLSASSKRQAFTLPPKPIEEHDVVYEKMLATKAELREVQLLYHETAQELAAIQNSRSWHLLRALGSIMQSLKVGR